MTNPELAPVATRDESGRFLPGNPGGAGNPFALQAARLRSALYDAVTPNDLAAVIQVLVAKAKEGSVPAARELLDRLLGKPEAIDLLERLGQLEELLASQRPTVEADHGPA
jgi:hypothetical protein